MDDLRVPYVVFGNNLVGSRGRRTDAVYYDDASSSRQLVEKLIAMGHRHIWYLGDLTLPWFRRRAEIYRHAMKAHGLTPNEYAEPYDRDDRDYGAKYGTRAVDCILAQERPVTAIIAGNDGIAYGAWRALQRAGLRVPGDLSLVGFDDVQEARLTDPELTTVHVPTEELGQACARMLLEKLQRRGTPQQHVMIGTRLVERGSWGPPKL
jgi:DNA-binding LacI/PurR family transcriptional regulator